METRELICIGCPLGCSITVSLTEEGVQSITGYTCKRGEKYAIDECLHPTRMVTSSVPAEGGNIKMLSVKTSDVIPKDRIKACMYELKALKVKAPVNIGDVIVKNIAGTGADMIATRNVNVADFCILDIKKNTIHNNL